MSNYSVRGLINWLFIIMICALAVNRYRQEMKHQKELEEIRQALSQESTKSNVVIEAERIAEEVNKNGDTVVIYKRAKPITNRIELIVEDRRKLDSIIRLNNLKDQKVQRYEKINSDLSAKLLMLSRYVTVTGDTIYKYNDKYISITQYIRDSVRLADVWADATPQKIDYKSKRKFFIGPSYNMSKIWFESPYLRSNGLDVVEFKEKEDFFGWGVDFDSKYIPVDKSLLLGPEAHIKLGRFKIQGGYMFGIPDNEWKLWYGGRYRIY